MNQKKNMKIIVIAIIIIILLIISSSLIYAYLATDFLKSDKQLFLKYISQALDSENGVLDSELTQYIQKKKNTPYTNNGNFHVNIDGSEEEKTKYTNNMDITFSGQNDATNSKIEQDISINYSDDVTLPFSFKKVGDTIGLKQSKYISKKYIAVNTNKLEDLNTNSSKSSIKGTTKSLGELEETLKVEFSKEEMENIKATYLEVLNQNLVDNNFSNVSENGKKGYKLSLNSQKLKNISIKILETLKSDQITLDKLNEYVTIKGNSSKITTNIIDEIIEEIENITEEFNVAIIVYQENGTISKLQIESEKINISVEKAKEDDELQYNISVDIINEGQKESTIYFNVKYNGLSTIQNVKEIYELGIEFYAGTNSASEKYSYRYNLENNVMFQDVSDIQEFLEEDTLNLNNLEEEQRNSIINAISQRLTAVNKMQMEELGLSENENPIINMIPTLYIYRTFSNGTMDETISEIEEAEIATFNSKFELYQGTNIGGGTVKGLLTVIANNNELNNDEDETETDDSTYEVAKKENVIKEINFNGEEYQVNKQTIALIKEEISTEDYFRVEFEKDENTGRIYRAVINKK